METAVNAKSCVLWQSKRQRNTNKCFIVCTSAELSTWGRLRVLKGNDVHTGKCSCLPPPATSQPGLLTELSLAHMFCRRLSPVQEVISITGLSFWGKMMLFYRSLLNNNHCTMRFSLLLCSYRAEADALHWSGMTDYRKPGLNLPLSSSLTSPSWIRMYLVLSN